MDWANPMVCNKSDRTDRNTPRTCIFPTWIIHCYTESCKRSETRLPFAAFIKHGFPLLSTTGPGKKSLEFQLPTIQSPSSPSMAADSVGLRTQPRQSLGSEVSSSGKTVQSERSLGACDPDEIITQFCRCCIESEWCFSIDENKNSNQVKENQITRDQQPYNQCVFIDQRIILLQGSSRDPWNGGHFTWIDHLLQLRTLA